MRANEEIIRRAYELQNAHKADELAEMYAEDSVFQDIPLGAFPKDHEEMKQLWKDTWASISNFAMTPDFVVADENGAAASFTMTGTQTGGFPGYPTVSGKTFSLKGGAMVKISEGKIVSWTDYWSTGDLERELGFTETSASTVAS